MKDTRPMNLDLTTFVFPPMAIVSICHRVAGVFLFALLPVMLYFLAMSLRDVSSFTELGLWLATPYCKVILWMYASATWYHVLAGVRHLGMDIGIGESLQAGRRSAIAVMILGAVGIIGLGVWIW